MQGIQLYNIIVVILVIIIPIKSEETWDYTNNTNNWPETCKLGLQQSPIDITGAYCHNKVVFSLKFENKFQDIYMDILDNNLKAYLKSGTLSEIYVSNFKGQTTGFTSQQFHVHTPSEHTVNGQHYDLEMHIVHSILPNFKMDRSKAVVAIFFQIQDNIAEQNTFFSRWDTQAEEETSQPFNMNNAFSGIFDGTGAFFLYEGSLTTPGCGEIVNWFVFEKPLPITSNQLSKIKQRIANIPTMHKSSYNNRPLQNINGRPILKQNTICIQSINQIILRACFALIVLLNIGIYLI